MQLLPLPQPVATHIAQGCFQNWLFLSLQAGMVRTGASWCRSENSSTCVLLSSLSWALYFLFICTCLLNCCGYHALHPKQTVSFNAFLGSDGTPFCPLYCVVYLECMGHHSLLTHVITLLVWLIRAPCLLHMYSVVHSPLCWLAVSMTLSKWTS